LKPINVEYTDNLDKLKEKLVVLLDDIYRKFDSLNGTVYDFVTGEPVEQQVITSVDSDQSDLDIAAHESTYNHANLHSQNTDTDLNATFEATLLDCDNHTNGSTNFVLVKQTAEADLNQTISDPPTQAQVQAISDKIDALLAKFRSANVIAT